jgi:sigma-B regulation protein RsbU (phosphoserine phosphatase)
VINSLGRKVFALATSIVVAASALSIWAGSHSAKRALLEQVQVDGELLGSVIGQAVGLSRDLPDELETALGQDMTSTARVVAHFVALAERRGLPTQELERELQRVAADIGVAEMWITDSTGRAYLTVPAGSSFTFSPDPQLQPQASAFWPLLSGKVREVVQPSRARDLDGRFFKYAGVPGVDKPRIVQIGMEDHFVERIRDRLSLQHLNHSLVRSKVLQRGLVVVDENLRPLVDASGSEPATLSDLDKAALQHAMASGRAQSELRPGSAVVYAAFRSPDDSESGAFIAHFDRQDLDSRLGQQLRFALLSGLAVLAGGAGLAHLFARRLTRPLEALTGVASRIGQGDFSTVDQLSAVQGQRDEIGQLGLVFESMARQVQNREQVLEDRVADRTQELLQKNVALSQAQAVIGSELDLARRLQLGILPEQFPPIAGLAGAARVRMQQQMGGDFYDFIPLAPGRVAVVMADVSGKGIAAAFFMAMARTSVALHLRQGADPAQCLKLANDDLCTSNPLDLFVTVFVAVLDSGSGLATCANGGHLPPVLCSPGGKVEVLPTPGDLALGVMPGMRYEQQTLALHADQTLVLVTDGVSEAFDSQGREYGMERLVAALSSQGKTDPQHLVDAVFADVDKHAAGMAQSDDITVAAVGRLH